MREALKRMCRERTELKEADLTVLEGYVPALEALANLTRADAFIDCLDREGCAFVAAEARPTCIPSSYTASVLGLAALPENEPAVYRAFLTGVSVHDLRAHTQLQQTVLQDVTPIFGAEGAVIGVLIAERDVSEETRMQKKLAAIEKSGAPQQRAQEGDAALFRAANHQIKNHLQILSSYCAIRMRSAKSEAERDCLEKTAYMLRAAAALHDNTVCAGGLEADGGVSVSTLLKGVAAGYRALLPKEGTEVTVICAEGTEEVRIPADKAPSLALAVSELITNAVRHAFPDGRGHIKVTLLSGNRRALITVEDNGTGGAAALSPKAGLPGTGLSLISYILRENLGGTLDLTSGENGTRAVCSFCIL